MLSCLRYIYRFIVHTSAFCFQVAIADHDGVLTCFGMKKGEAMVGVEFELRFLSFTVVRSVQWDLMCVDFLSDVSNVN